LENLVAYQKALLELELVKGTTLVSRNVEMTKAQLQDLTEKLLAANRFSGPEIQAIRWEVDEQYKERIKDLDMHEKPQTLRQRIFN
ncbi:MAG TPA: hypothetical protein VGR78_06545, partial [Verrucomicrobiae bacterium]|nr:hypothetical protein [Verrucomicrobiae bacterium]